MIRELMEKFHIKHRFSTPYHPKTNGLVERFNKTLCEALAKLEEKNEKTWDLNIAPVLFAYRTNKHNSVKIELFYLVYGRQEVLPSDKEEKEITLIGKLKFNVNELPKIRNKAKEESEKSQIKQKEYHDKQIK